MSGFGSALNSAAAVAYDLSFQISPIILNGGIAASVQGAMLPVINLLPGLLASTILNVVGTGLGGLGNEYDELPRFLPMPGSTLISNEIGMYPFANQTIAANALVQQPLAISLMLIAPVNTPGGYLQKLSMFSGLQNSLQLHNNSGGTYFIATPAFVYGPCLMLQLVDATEVGGEDHQVQIRWRFDFSQPILTAAGAQNSENNLISAITAGTQLEPNPTLSSANIASPNPTLFGITSALSAFGGLP